MTARNRRMLLALLGGIACSDDVQLADDDGTSSSSGGEETLAPADSSESGGDESSTSTGAPTPSAECGNGVLEFGEDCDDGNDGDPDDGCTDVCSLPGCGDGFVQPSLGEACDAGPEGDVFCGTTCSSRHALQWLDEVASRSAGDDAAYGVAIDGTGSVIVVGSVDDDGEDAIGRNLWLRKYSPDGRTLWTVEHDSAVAASNDYGYDVTVDADDNVYAAGTVPVLANQDDGIVLAFDSDGGPRWTAMHQGAAGFDDGIASIAATPDGRVLVAGFVFDDPGASIVGWYGVLDAADGTEVFSASLDTPTDEYSQLYAAAVGPEGELAVAGVLSEDNIVRVLEPGGTERWSLQFHAIDDAEDAARGLAFTDDGGLLVAGSGTHAYLRNFDADGAERWSQVYAFSEASALDVAITSDGVIVMIGSDSSLGSSGGTPALFGIDPEGGAEVWRNAPLGGAVVGFGRRVAAGSDGAFAVVGTETPHIFDGDDLWVASYRPE